MIKIERYRTESLKLLLFHGGETTPNFRLNYLIFEFFSMVSKNSPIDFNVCHRFVKTRIFCTGNMILLGQIKRISICRTDGC